MKSTPGVNSSSLGSWPEAASSSMSWIDTTLTEAGASVIRSSRRDTEVTVMVSAKLTSQSTFLSTVREPPASTATLASDAEWSRSENSTV